ncbi:MAG: citrate/2-methylcitrate synthase [Longimicrobiales bacterium]
MNEVVKLAPPGLKGLIVADTTVGGVRGTEGFFHYRHYDACEVARLRAFEAAVLLLIDGELPSGDSEARFRKQLGTARTLDPGARSVLSAVAAQTDSPLSGLQALIPIFTANTPWLDLDAGQRRSAAVRVAAAVPTVLASLHRLGQGQEPVPPDPNLGHAADFVRMVTGTVAAPQLTRAVETYLTLTADHGFNASTFTTRVVASTGAGIGSVLASAVAALSGPLHGGAPSRVLDMINDIGDPDNTERWAQSAVQEGVKIMGFGHAVYRAEDPRSLLLRDVALGLGGDLVTTAQEIEERMLRFLADWKPSATIVTNVEFYAAVVLHLAGIPQEMFTPAFTTSRVFGWTAHLLEQASNNKILRPSARYVGESPPVPVPT